MEYVQSVVTTHTVVVTQTLSVAVNLDLLARVDSVKVLHVHCIYICT